MTKHSHTIGGSSSIWLFHIESVTVALQLMSMRLRLRLRRHPIMTLVVCSPFYFSPQYPGKFPSIQHHIHIEISKLRRTLTLKEQDVA